MHGNSETAVGCVHCYGVVSVLDDVEVRVMVIVTPVIVWTRLNQV